MDPDIRKNRFVHVHMIGLSAMGLVRFKDATFPFLADFICFWIIFLIGSFNALQYVYLYINLGDLIRLTTRGGSILLYTSLVFKVITTVVYNDKYNEIITDMHKTMMEIEKSGDMEIRNILNRYVKKNAFITKVVTGTCGFSVFMFNVYVILALFVLSKPGEPIELFAIAVYFPNMSIEDNKIFVFVILELIIMTVGPLIAFWNTIIISFFIYIQSSLDILNYKLRNFDKFTGNGSIDRLRIDQNKSTYRFLVQCIEEHLKIIRMLFIVKHIIKIPMNMDFLIVAVILCAEMFVMSLIPFGLEMVITWGYLATIFTIFFMHYWHANEILLRSTNLSEAAFESPWLGIETKSKLALLLLIQRSHRPLIMKAGLYPMNLQTFLMILRVTYSAATLLRQVNEN